MIYLDVLLLVNFLCAYFLLLAAGALSGARAGFGRMVGAAALAAATALVLLAPPAPYPLQVGYKLASAGAVTAAAFGVKPWRRWLTTGCWFAALNLGMAGLAVLAVLKTGTPLVKTGNLTVYLRVPPLLLVGCAGGCTLLVEAGLRLLNRPGQGPCAEFVFELCGCTVHLRAVEDTGCHLQDPVSCLPVLLVSWQDAAPHLPGAVNRYLQGWFAGQRREALPEGAALRVIPCTTAVGSDLLPGFAVENLRLRDARGTRPVGRSTVAFAPQSFGGGTHGEALYGPHFL